MIRVQENHLCQRRTNESLHAQNAILPLTYLTAEPLLVQDAPHLFNVTWQNVPNVGMSFHCQRNVGILIPIFCKKSKRTIIQLNQFSDLYIFCEYQIRTFIAYSHTPSFNSFNWL